MAGRRFEGQQERAAGAQPPLADPPSAAPPTLADAIGLNRGQTPFPWQATLLSDWFAKGRVPRAVDIPTGLGKTSVMAIWLTARAAGAPLPRRLVYVVDRRAVVDQATEEAERLRAFVDAQAGVRTALGLTRSLPISTLRGQHVDNREWLEDPAGPAIIVGTVDMIGSRLLFEGYRCSRKMRPYHAALLGVDALIVLDEAHLVPPFERLVESIVLGAATFGPRAEANRAVVPPTHLMALSATGAQTDGALELSRLDHQDPVIRKRLHATKRLIIRDPIDAEKTELASTLADEAWKLSALGTARSAASCSVTGETTRRRSGKRSKQSRPVTTRQARPQLRSRSRSSSSERGASTSDRRRGAG